jgi:hypothetical protein
MAGKKNARDIWTAIRSDLDFRPESHNRRFFNIRDATSRNLAEFLKSSKEFFQSGR